MSSTKLEWVRNADGTQGHSANPIRFRMKDTGKVVHFCVKHSSGCAHCYSETLGRRWGAAEFIARNLDKVECFLDEKVLQAILRRRKPTTFFLADMTDWMGAWIPDEFIDCMLATMAVCPQHTFQLLTKRAERLPAYFCGLNNRRRGFIHEHRGLLVESLGRFLSVEEINRAWHRMKVFHHGIEPAQSIGDATAWPWPLPNVWLGVSCENQATADERIPHLLATPAAVWFLSCEPLLGEIDLRRWLSGRDDLGNCNACAHPVRCRCEPPFPSLDWVICGAESGPRRRPMSPDWARWLVDQCRTAGVACFVKQLPINGRVSHDLDEWPAEMRIRQMPAGRSREGE